MIGSVTKMLQRVFSSARLISNHTRRRVPDFDFLEDRFAPTVGVETIRWTGGGDGRNWFDANNWRPARVPEASDTMS